MEESRGGAMAQAVRPKREAGPLGAAQQVDPVEREKDQAMAAEVNERRWVESFERQVPGGMRERGKGRWRERKSTICDLYLSFSCMAYKGVDILPETDYRSPSSPNNKIESTSIFTISESISKIGQSNLLP